MHLCTLKRGMRDLWMMLCDGTRWSCMGAGLEKGVMSEFDKRHLLIGYDYMGKQ